MTQQKRTDQPEYTILGPMDKDIEDFLFQLRHEPRVQFVCNLNEEEEYHVHNPDGTVTIISLTPEINNVRWHLMPGVNQIPLTFFEHLVQCPEQRRLMPSPQANVFVDIATIPALPDMSHFIVLDEIHDKQQETLKAKEITHAV